MYIHENLCVDPKQCFSVQVCCGIQHVPKHGMSLTGEVQNRVQSSFSRQTIESACMFSHDNNLSLRQGYLTKLCPANTKSCSMLKACSVAVRIQFGSRLSMLCSIALSQLSTIQFWTKQSNVFLSKIVVGHCCATSNEHLNILSGAARKKC